MNSYDTTHERQLHLFAVRDSAPAGIRDAAAGARFSEFQHLHPTFLGDGTWQLDDFSARSGGTVRLIADLQTRGEAVQPQSTLKLAPDASRTPADDSGGWAAHPTSLGAGETSFHVAGADGTPIDRTEPLLGAAGHLALFDTSVTGARVKMVHTHPTSNLRAGSLSFKTETQPGTQYEGWLQVKPAGTEPVAIPVALSEGNTGDLANAHSSH